MTTDNNEEKITISDVIKYEEDIKPFPLVKIYSGVGSGKSFFATSMITGSKKYGIPKHNVLIITSRRSKVEETLKEMGVLVSEKITKNGNLNFDVFVTGDISPDESEQYAKAIKYTTEWGEATHITYNKSVICTNAYIAAYLRYVHEPDNPITHIWNKFDAIIIDEVHSLITDATYQPATYAVLSLIKEYLKLHQNKQLQTCACKHLILMTGTPQPFEELIKLDFPKEMTNTRYLFEECENVVPDNVIIIDELSSIKRVKGLLLSGEKIIYFTNHALTESAARKKFDLPDTIRIGVSFSSEDKRRRLSTEEQDIISDIDDSLSNHSLIPDYVQLFVTTSRNKEGINIHNKDFHNMFIETHLMYDAVQMAGRVRAGIENFYIISNVGQFEYGNNITDILFSKKIMVENIDYANSDDEANKYLINEYWKKESDTEQADEDKRKIIRYYIEYIENRFAYIRYNVFNQRFEFFCQKEDAEKYVTKHIKDFRKMLLSDDTAFVQDWFPLSSISRELSVVERATIYLKNIIGSKNYITLSKDELKKHLSVIRELFNSPLTSPNPILHLVDEKFNCEQNGTKYDLYYGKENPRTKRKPMRTRKKKK